MVNNLKTWIEIDAWAAKKNYKTFRKLIGPKVKFWAVVKSNAYGHGLLVFSKLVNSFGIDGFCVDSVIEGMALRKAGIRKPILSLGPTLPSLYKEAAKNKIAVEISNIRALRTLARVKNPPQFHLKIDTGMHRQGFYLKDLPAVIKFLEKRSNFKSKLTDLYTHFASAKDINYPTYTENQFRNFEAAAKLFESAGFKHLTKHVAATGGTLVNPKYHLDAVRIGIGLYGLWPSKELEVQLGDKVKLHPVLSWRVIVSEVKNLKRGDYVGYDMAERVPKNMRIAILPIGYWHGFPRTLSVGMGEVILNGRRSKVVGRVSMDLTAVVASARAKVGDIATLIGCSGKGEISATEIAQKSGTTHYEFLTRLNPLMERIVKR